MWSDNDIDNAFRRLDPAEPGPTPFPLDAWLKLEAGLDQSVIDRAVRRRLWQFFAAEVAVVALVGLGWLLWPTSALVSVTSKVPPLASASEALPMRKAAGTKQTRGAGVSLANIPVAPAARPAVGHVVPTLPRPASTLLPSSQTVAPTANAVTAAIASHGALAGRQHLPLVGAVIPAHYPAPVARFHSADSQVAALSKGVALPFGPKPRHLGSASRPQAAGPEPKAHSPAVAAWATGANPSGGASSDPAAQPASSNPAVPSGTTREAVVAGVNSLSAPLSAGYRQALEPLAADRPINSSASAAVLQPASGDARLAPAVASSATLQLPTAAPVPTRVVPIELTPVPLPAAVRQPRFFVGVVAAPDVSTVKFANVRAPHLNVGLTLEYRLGQRWRVATGVQRAAKDYAARRQDYDWGYSSRAYTRDFTWVDGSCTILDVPLNLRYDAVVAPHYRVFGTVGLSSFFMQRERYAYAYYDNVTNAPAVWERSYVNANQHLFSVLNLSAGYEYGLGTHWRLQAEPYVKVPLAGVGAGKVKLLSAGLYFGVKYGF